MHSNMEKAAWWAASAEGQTEAEDRAADAAVAQVYATMVLADQVAELRYWGAPGGPQPKKWEAGS
jgi:hypothetical protein